MVSVISPQVERLQGSLGRGKPKAEIAVFAAELQRATRGWAPDELRHAVTSIIDSEDRFPNIRTIKLHRGARPTPAQQQNDPSICNRCGKKPYTVGFEFPTGAVLGRIRCDCPVDGPGWFTPRAVAYVEKDPALIAAGYGTPAKREDWSA